MVIFLDGNIREGVFVFAGRLLLRFLLRFLLWLRLGLSFGLGRLRLLTLNRFAQFGYPLLLLLHALLLLDHVSLRLSQLLPSRDHLLRLRDSLRQNFLFQFDLALLLLSLELAFKLHPFNVLRVFLNFHPHLVYLLLVRHFCLQACLSLLSEVLLELAVLIGSLKFPGAHGRHLDLPLGVAPSHLFKEVELGLVELLPSQQHVVRVDSARFAPDLLVAGLHLALPLVEASEFFLYLICLDLVDSQLHLPVVLLPSFDSQALGF